MKLLLELMILLVGIDNFMASRLSETFQICNLTKFTEHHGEISYFSPSIHRDHFSKCNWTFSLPKTKLFIFVLNFDLLQNYGYEDVLILPDGTSLARQMIKSDDNPLCLSFTLSESRSTSCVLELKNVHCLDGQIRVVNQIFHLSVESRPPSENQFEESKPINFHVSYEYHFCKENRSARQQVRQQNQGINLPTIVVSTSTTGWSLAQVIVVVFVLLVCFVFIAILSFILWKEYGVFAWCFSDRDSIGHSSRHSEKSPAAINQSHFPEVQKPSVIPQVNPYQLQPGFNPYQVYTAQTATPVTYQPRSPAYLPNENQNKQDQAPPMYIPDVPPPFDEVSYDSRLSDSTSYSEKRSIDDTDKSGYTTGYTSETESIFSQDVSNDARYLDKSVRFHDDLSQPATTRRERRQSPMNRPRSQSASPRYRRRHVSKTPTDLVITIVDPTDANVVTNFDAYGNPLNSIENNLLPVITVADANYAGQPVHYLNNNQDNLSTTSTYITTSTASSVVPYNELPTYADMRLVQNNPILVPQEMNNFVAYPSNYIETDVAGAQPRSILKKSATPPLIFTYPDQETYQGISTVDNTAWPVIYDEQMQMQPRRIPENILPNQVVVPSYQLVSNAPPGQMTPNSTASDKKPSTDWQSKMMSTMIKNNQNDQSGAESTAVMWLATVLVATIMSLLKSQSPQAERKLSLVQNFMKSMVKNHSQNITEAPTPNSLARVRFADAPQEQEKQLLNADMEPSSSGTRNFEPLSSANKMTKESNVISSKTVPSETRDLNEIKKSNSSQHKHFEEKSSLGFAQRESFTPKGTSKSFEPKSVADTKLAKAYAELLEKVNQMEISKFYDAKASLVSSPQSVYEPAVNCDDVNDEATVEKDGKMYSLAKIIALNLITDAIKELDAAENTDGSSISANRNQESSNQGPALSVVNEIKEPLTAVTVEITAPQTAQASTSGRLAVPAPKPAEVSSSVEYVDAKEDLPSVVKKHSKQIDVDDRSTPTERWQKLVSSFVDRKSKEALFSKVVEQVEQTVQKDLNAARKSETAQSVPAEISKQPSHTQTVNDNQQKENVSQDQPLQSNEAQVNQQIAETPEQPSHSRAKIPSQQRLSGSLPPSNPSQMSTKSNAKELNDGNINSKSSLTQSKTADNGPSATNQAPEIAEEKNASTQEVDTEATEKEDVNKLEN